MGNNNDRLDLNDSLLNGYPKNLRYERKFRPGQLDLAEMQLLLKLHPKGFSKSYPDRQINNIYLDRSNLASFHENIEFF